MIAERIQVPPLRLLDLARERFPREKIARCASHLRWVKPSLFGNQYELRSPERCIGTLRILGLYRPRARGEGITGCWMFEPLESGTGKLAVRTPDSFGDAAVFDMTFSDHGGMLRFADGRALVLNSDFWKGCAEFQTTSGEPLIRYRFRGLLKPSAEIEILGEARRLPELTWILMLGWYLIVGYL